MYYIIHFYVSHSYTSWWGHAADEQARCKIADDNVAFCYAAVCVKCSASVVLHLHECTRAMPVLPLQQCKTFGPADAHHQLQQALLKRNTKLISWLHTSRHEHSISNQASLPTALSRVRPLATWLGHFPWGANKRSPHFMLLKHWFPMVQRLHHWWPCVTAEPK